jgi:hypothetical protein
MKQQPPHLPEKSQKVDTYDKVQSLFGFITLVFIAFLSGLAATFFVIAWFVPQVNQQFVYNSIERVNTLDSNKNIDAAVQHSVRQKVVSIYNNKFSLEHGFYDEKAKIGRAVLLSMDGWAVMYGDISIETKFLDAIDHKGEMFTIEKVVFDSFSDMTYVKLKGAGFQVSSFTDWKLIDTEELFWSMDWYQWKHIFIDRTIKTQEKSLFSIWESQYDTIVSQYTNSGSIVFDEDGNFVGFIKEDNKLLLGFVVEDQIERVLGEKYFLHESLPVAGFIVDIPENILSEDVNIGFYVEESDLFLPDGSQPIFTGDVIIKINKEKVNPKTLDRLLFLQHNIISLDIVRDGKILTVEVEKQPIKI